MPQPIDLEGDMYSEPPPDTQDKLPDGFKLPAQDEDAVLDIAGLKNNARTKAIVLAAETARIEVLRQLQLTGYRFDEALVAAARAGNAKAVDAFLSTGLVTPEKKSLVRAFNEAATNNAVETLKTLTPHMSVPGDLFAAAIVAADNGATAAMAYLADVDIKNWQAAGRPSRSDHYNVLAYNFNTAIKAGHRETAAVILRALKDSGMQPPPPPPSGDSLYSHQLPVVK